ncbi:MAG: hypothetical protein H0V29_07145 [Thermoleophilaceae bacterium]|nr:hypothetical protein [Thermoleophilaceae bacterium]
MRPFREGALRGRAATFAVVAGCGVLPADNPWNQRVDQLPAAASSDRVVSAIGSADRSHADFGSGKFEGRPIGIPYTTVKKGTRKKRGRFEFAGESDKGPYPIPRRLPIEGGSSSDGDRHAIVVERGTCRLYELYRYFPGRSRFRAGSGAIFELRSNRLRPEGFTSADAAGLPILPGLARFDEVKKGAIDHALRITVERTRNSFVYPARHFASDLSDGDLPPMGIRFRLKASVNASSFPPQARVVVEALKRYGAFIADNGSNWYVSGAPNRGWNNDQLRSIRGIRGSDWEVVDTSSLARPGL